MAASGGFETGSLGTAKVLKSDTDYAGVATNRDADELRVFSKEFKDDVPVEFYNPSFRGSTFRVSFPMVSSYVPLS